MSWEVQARQKREKYETPCASASPSSSASSISFYCFSTRLAREKRRTFQVHFQTFRARRFSFCSADKRSCPTPRQRRKYTQYLQMVSHYSLLVPPPSVGAAAAVSTNLCWQLPSLVSALTLHHHPSLALCRECELACNYHSCSTSAVTAGVIYLFKRALNAMGGFESSLPAQKGTLLISVGCFQGPISWLSAAS